MQRQCKVQSARLSKVGFDAVKKIRSGGDVHECYLGMGIKWAPIRLFVGSRTRGGDAGTCR